MIQLNEGLDYHDLKGQLEPKVSIDEYKAKMGDDADIVTITFTLNSRLAADDLTKWLEKGYDFIHDASVSDGEVQPGKWLVFAEMNRRSSVPARLIEILEDLNTLTDLEVKDYTIEVDEHEYDANADVLKQVVVLSPHEYREKNDDQNELNEMRQIAGLNNKNVFENIDDEIRKYITNAGL
jgi:hypothetical protein